MRINLGIRRRLFPLLGNHRRRAELMNALLFSMPGTPVIYYGDEIGMGDNIHLGDRDGVRTPMQWSADRNAGFSCANPQELYLPVTISPEYHFEVINVEVQQSNLHSVLWWMKRLIALRKRYKAFGRGSIEFLHPENNRILAFVRQFGQERILVVANLSRFVQHVQLDMASYQGMTPIEIFGRTEFPVIGSRPYFLSLGPHNCPGTCKKRAGSEARPVPSSDVRSRMHFQLPRRLRRPRFYSSKSNTWPAIRRPMYCPSVIVMMMARKN
jgi:maltose alpha-D-glucosyltransferase/alpha-amylase